MSGWTCKICDCTQICSSEQLFGEVETRFEFIMAPEEVALEHCEIDNVAGFSMELERVNDGEMPKSSWSARIVANVIGVRKPPWM